MSKRYAIYITGFIFIFFTLINVIFIHPPWREPDFIIEAEIGDRPNANYMFDYGFPTRDQIEAFLNDKTFIKSIGGNLNQVVYFDEDYRFYVWHGNEISKGNWSTHSAFQSVVLNEKQTFLRSQVFCMRIIENHECDQCDNCINVHSLNDLIQRQTETKSGDVFKLSTRFAAPFVLPGTAISADVLMSKMVTEDKLKGTLNGE